MAKVIKREGKSIQAWELGTGSEMERKLIEEGKIVFFNGAYELFSQESKNGSGEKANAGDFFKVDNAGFPYPNKRDWFLKNHRHISGDNWEQFPKPLLAWEAKEGIDLPPEVQFLVDCRGLVLDPSNPDKFFGAQLWGSWLTAAKDSVLIFYSVKYDENGDVIDADFNFVARSEFEATYRYIEH